MWPKDNISKILNAEVKISDEMRENSSSVMAMLRFSGLCPLKVERDASGLSLKLSNWHLLCSYIYGLLILSTAYYRDIDENYTGKEKPSYLCKKIDGYLRSIDFNCTCALVFCGIFVIPWKVSDFFKYVKYINQVDSVIKPAYSKKRKYRSVLILVAFLTFQILIDLMGFYADYLGNKPLWQSIKNFGIYAVFMMCSYVIFINRYMADSLDMRITKLHEVLEEKYIEMKKAKRSREEGKPIQFGNLSWYSHSKAVSIKKLTKTYLRLMDASDMLSYLFGLNALVASISLVCGLISITYFMIVNLLRTKSFLMVVYTTSIFFVRIFRVLLLFEPWHSCATQVIGTVVTYLVISLQQQEHDAAIN